MGATMALMAGNTASGFLSQQAQASALGRQANFTSKLAELDAQDAIARGNQAADLRASQGRRMVGAQRAAAAASGIDANTGTAADLQSGESFLSALDQQTIRNNAAREAWGYKTQGDFDALGLRNQAANAKVQSVNTLLTGATNAYGLYRSHRNTMTAQPQPAAPRGGYNVFPK